MWRRLVRAYPSSARVCRAAAASSARRSANLSTCRRATLSRFRSATSATTRSHRSCGAPPPRPRARRFREPRTRVYRGLRAAPGRELDTRSQISGRVSDDLLTFVKIQGKARRHVTAAWVVLPARWPPPPGRWRRRGALGAPPGRGRRRGGPGGSASRRRPGRIPHPGLGRAERRHNHRASRSGRSHQRGQAREVLVRGRTRTRAACHGRPRQRIRGARRVLRADTGRMRYLDLGTAKEISKIGLGTWQFGSREWGYGERYDSQEAQAIVSRALELGVTLFDTAEIYGFGRSERILGQALGEDRERVFLATKIFPVLPVAPVVEQRAVASAGRLGARRLDLYQVHQPNPLIRDGTIMRGMRALQRVGLVGEVGVSNYSLQRWRAAEDALGGPVLSNQVPYSLVARGPEQDLLPYASSHDRVVLAYSPLAQGLLSGRYNPGNRPANRVRASNPLFLPENLERAAELLATLREVADAHGATPAQIALAWVIHHPAVVAIPGASSVGQLESNVAAADIDLTEDEYQALHAAAARFRPVTGPAVLPHLLRSRIARLGWPGDRYRRRRRAHPDQLRHHHRGR